MIGVVHDSSLSNVVVWRDTNTNGYCDSTSAQLSYCALRGYISLNPSLSVHHFERQYYLQICSASNMY